MESLEQKITSLQEEYVRLAAEEKRLDDKIEPLEAQVNRLKAMEEQAKSLEDNIARCKHSIEAKSQRCFQLTHELNILQEAHEPEHYPPDDLKRIGKNLSEDMPTHDEHQLAGGVSMPENIPAADPEGQPDRDKVDEFIESISEVPVSEQSEAEPVDVPAEESDSFAEVFETEEESV